MSAFKPKGEDEIRKELLKELGEDFDTDKLDKLVQREIKSEELKGSLHKGKTKAQKKAKDMEQGKNFYKKKNPKQDKKPKGEKPEVKKEISEDEIIDKAMLKMKGYGKDDFRRMDQVRKVYKEEGKNISFDDARKTKLFISMKTTADEKSNDRSAQLGSSGLGTGSKSKKIQPKTQEEKEFVEAMRE